MRKPWARTIGIVAAIACIGVAHANPLAQAREGMVQCFEPDAAHKTCNMMSSYTFAHGRVTNVSEILLSSNPVVVIKSDSPVEIRGPAVCGPLRKKDMDDATILIDGWAAPAEKAAPIKAKLEAASKPLFGKVVCSVDQPEGNIFVERSTLNGKPQPDLAKEFIWVRADAGYDVAP